MNGHPDPSTTVESGDPTPPSRRFFQSNRAHVIGEGIASFSWWCIRVLLIVATAGALAYLIMRFWSGVLPLVLAILVSSVLSGPVRALKRRKVPGALAALVVLLATLIVFGGIIGFIAPSMLRQSQTLYLQTLEGIQRLQLWLQGPPLNIHAEQLNDYVQHAVSWLQSKTGDIAGEFFAGIGAATQAITTLLVVLILTFFFLKDGERFLPWVRTITGAPLGNHLTEVLTRVWTTLSGYIRAQAIVSLVDACFIGLGLVIVGVPMALALAVLTFIAGFIPIVGAVVAGALAVIIALVSLGVTKAIIILLVVLAVQQLEGNVLSPMLQSKAMNLHPVIILTSVTIGSSLFGIVGAFLSVPFAATIAVVLRYLLDIVSLKTGESSYDDIAFVTDFDLPARGE